MLSVSSLIDASVVTNDDDDDEDDEDGEATELKSDASKEGSTLLDKT